MAGEQHDAALPEREAFDQLMRIGGQMANVCFNWSQEANYFGSKLGGNERNMLSNLRKQWDEARAAIAQHRAQEWQPIETAPKDGTRLLVWGGGEVREGWCTGVGTARDGGDVWRGHSLVPYTGRPTHWMPLPAAPLNKDATA